MRPVWAYSCAMAILSSTALAQQVSAKKRPAADAPAPGLMGGIWHGAVEMRHHLVTFYDETSAPVRQEPTVHARAQLGAQFYDGFADLYATLGVYKRAQTVQVQQRRPELALDLRPITSEYVEVLQYTVIKLPFQQQDPDPEAHEPETSDGSILVFGLAPLFKAPVEANGTRLTFKAGFETWTKLYSRRQYTDIYDDAGTEEDEGRLSLAAGESDAEPIEDFAPHYDSQALVGLQVVPTTMLSGLKADIAGHHHSSFRPRYTKYESSVDYTYAVDRYSFYSIKLEYELSSRVAVVNELYAYYDGLFQEQRSGDERRFRNVARLTCKL